MTIHTLHELYPALTSRRATPEQLAAANALLVAYGADPAEVSEFKHNATQGRLICTLRGEHLGGQEWTLIERVYPTNHGPDRHRWWQRALEKLRTAASR
jgi:hypothetical protein